MTQQKVLDLARQGNPEAIATLINHSTQPRGIQAEAVRAGHQLHVNLYAAQTPNQKAVVSLIDRGMRTLQTPVFSEVLLSAYHNDRRTLFWQYRLELMAAPLQETVPPSALVPAPPVTAALLTSQRLPLMSRYPAGYQDVIVRFSDPHTAAVRCLTTLTEFLQALRKPSFSFMAIAADPSLRLLLDVIADSCTTDDKGEQLLTNVSILQPGKPWQPVRVRLTSDVAFETDAPDLHADLSELLPAIAPPVHDAPTPGSIPSYDVLMPEAAPETAPETSVEPAKPTRNFPEPPAESLEDFLSALDSATPAARGEELGDDPSVTVGPSLNSQPVTEPDDLQDLFASFEAPSSGDSPNFFAGLAPEPSLPSAPESNLEDLFADFESQSEPAIDLSNFLDAPPSLTLEEFSFELDGVNQT
jgi:hypothetical protein